jgi:lipoprotein-anchoring transpeptidase ErfK/SrfK
VLYPERKHPLKPSYQAAIQQARQALKKGDRRTARHWAQQAVALAPEQEEPWLIVAALASPRASLEYLKHALEINPGSSRARKGMHWAIQRYREITPPTQALQLHIQTPLPSTPNRRATLYPLALVLMAAILGFMVWFGTPSFSFASDRSVNILEIAQEIITKATYTPTPTLTFTPTPTFTASPTPTDTPTAIPTYTETPIPTATREPASVAPREKEKDEEVVPKIHLPSGVKKGEIWIDVDLTNQRLSVYKGKNLLDAFAVSTGTWRTPTVTGQYRVYVKYTAADMAGPGYYLPSVPYVMYFYEGYGIHGTYWHNNFGTPMSHGCVNLRTDNAEWVYNKASVGTVVNIHY